MSPGQSPHRAHTGPTQSPHRAHTEPTVKTWEKCICALSRIELYRFLFLEDAQRHFSQVFTVGSVWALCGLCVGSVWALCGLCLGDTAATHGWCYLHKKCHLEYIQLAFTLMDLSHANLAQHVAMIMHHGTWISITKHETIC